jgi:putative serine protease PepD
MTEPTHNVQPSSTQHDELTAPPAPRSATPNQPSRARRGVAAVAAALVLMLGAGAAGGWAATEIDQNDTAATGQAAAPAGDGSFADVVKAVEPRVVSITTGTGEGSGVIFDADGHILTNNHVVATATGDKVTVVLNDGSSRDATIVGTDPRSDLAVVKVADTSGLKPATFGNSDAVQVGDAVLALGSPLGLQDTVTSGIVSAKNRTIHEGGQQSPAGGAVTSISGLIQTDAAINPGNSGGALVDASGDVIGINTAIATASGSNGNIGVGFAIPSNTAKNVAEQLIKGGKVSHPYLGVAVADDDGAGAIVKSVEPNGPAADAGLEPGDLITKVGDQSIHGSDDLVSAIQSGSMGQHLSITYTRDGQSHTATVTLGDAPQ